MSIYQRANNPHNTNKNVECHTKGLQTPICLELNYIFIQAEFIYEKKRDFIKRYQILVYKLNNKVLKSNNMHLRTMCHLTLILQ